MSIYVQSNKLKKQPVQVNLHWEADPAPPVPLYVYLGNPKFNIN